MIHGYEIYSILFYSIHKKCEVNFCQFLHFFSETVSCTLSLLFCLITERFNTENYSKRKYSYDKCVPKFCQQYQDSPSSSKLFVLKLYKNGIKLGQLPIGRDINQSTCSHQKLSNASKQDSACVKMFLGDQLCQCSTKTLMMETEEISETLVFSSTLTWLIARENFSPFIHRESLKSYIRPRLTMKMSLY
jgi:hypothetical protein